MKDVPTTVIEYASDDLAATAFHESGHVIMALLQGHSVVEASVSVNPDENGRLGWVMGSWSSVVNESEDIIEDAKLSLAGPIAESLHKAGFQPGVDPSAAVIKGLELIDGYQDDLKVIAKLKKLETPTVAEVTHFVLRTIADYWIGVAWIAEELQQKKTLSGAEIGQALWALACMKLGSDAMPRFSSPRLRRVASAKRRRGKRHER